MAILIWQGFRKVGEKRRWETLPSGNHKQRVVGKEVVICKAKVTHLKFPPFVDDKVLFEVFMQLHLHRARETTGS